MDNRVIAHEMQKARRQPPQTFTSAFLLPFGAPGDIPPCIRQRPFGIAADRQPLPLLVRALNVFANVGTVADVGNYVGTGMEGLPTRLGALPGAHRGRVQCAPGCCPAAPVGVAAAAELSGLLQRRRLSFWPYGAGCNHRHCRLLRTRCKRPSSRCGSKERDNVPAASSFEDRGPLRLCRLGPPQ